MKAIVKDSMEKGVIYTDIEKPCLKDDEVMIEVKAAAICGTDIHYYQWDETARGFGNKFGIKFPFVLGHECAGIIVDIGSKVKNRRVGQRVAIETHIPCGNCFECQNGMQHNCTNMKIYGTSCNGCFANYAVVSSESTFVLPEEMSYEEGALLEPAGVAMRAVEESGIIPGDTVIVNGCGPIGLFLIQILKVSGAAKILAIDIDQYRLNLAKKLGALPIDLHKVDVVSEVNKCTNNRKGADVIFETSGVASAYNKVFEMIRNEGTLITVGHPEETIVVDIMKDINIRGIKIKGIFGRRIWNTWWNLSSLIVAKKINLLDVVTHYYQFFQCEEAFEQLNKGAGKIMFIDSSIK